MASCALFRMSLNTGIDTPATLSGYIFVVTEGFFASKVLSCKRK